MKCELCERPSSVHVTDARTGQQTSYCEQHAMETGALPEDPFAEFLKVSSDSIRKLVEFIRTNNRMPTACELSELGRAAEQVKDLEMVADFIHSHFRFPREEELPPDPS